MRLHPTHHRPACRCDEQLECPSTPRSTARSPITTLALNRHHCWPPQFPIGQAHSCGHMAIPPSQIAGLPSYGLLAIGVARLIVERIREWCCLSVPSTTFGGGPPVYLRILGFQVRFAGARKIAICARHRCTRPSSTRGGRFLLPGARSARPADTANASDFPPPLANFGRGVPPSRWDGLDVSTGCAGSFG